VDGVTFAAIETSGLEAWLAGLGEELVLTTYRPRPVRRVRSRSRIVEASVTVRDPGGSNRRQAGVGTDLFHAARELDLVG